MSRLPVALLLIFCLHAGSVYGTECFSSRDKNFLERMVTSCPRPLIDPSENVYCCYELSSDAPYCCSAAEYARIGLGIIIPVVIAAAVVIALIVCCISCLCCTCCPWYRRRHRQGTVYGKVQAPVVQVIQPQASIPPTITTIPPSYTSQPAQNYVPYPTESTGMPMPQPPPYNEAYAKQAPYNPDYPQ